MKGFTGFLAAALVLAAVGAIGLAVWRIEGHLAAVHDQTATQQFEQAQQSLDEASEFVAYVDWVPGVGRDFRDQIRMRQAVLQYWQRNYDALVSQEPDRTAPEIEPSVDLQLVLANGSYRAGQARATTRAATLEALDQAVSGYATVLRNSRWRSDAAYNYEYAIRLRDETTKGRKPPSAASPVRGDTELGLQGEPAAMTRPRFEIYIPLDNGESRPVGGDAGKAPPGTRKG
jgi:hypothetical protein